MSLMRRKKETPASEKQDETAEVKSEEESAPAEEAAAQGEAAAPEAAVTAAGEPVLVCADEQAESIEDRIVQLEEKLEAERAQALRVLADFQNYRRRSEEQRQEIASRTVQSFVAELLPVLDNFERALAASRESQSFDSLVSGVEMILRQLREILERHGVVPIEAVGHPFDPNLHDAVMRVEAADVEDNTVVEELQRGYMMDGRVIRPAMVKVAKRS